MNAQSYIIVGGGVFGASTAYYLSQAQPEGSITLIDRSPSFPCPLAASHDFNKIVRADYGSLFYCELALKARELWKKDPLYKPFYHQSGLVNMDDSDLGRRIIKNYETLNEDTGSEIIGPDEMKKRYNGIFAHTDYRGVKDIFVNPTSGWAEATLALRNVIEAAIGNGIKYQAGDIEVLIFGSNGECTGVKTKEGQTLHADKIILCTGAGTARLLADSAPNRPNLQVGDRITSSAVVTGTVKLSADQRERFNIAPSFVHAVGEVLGA